MLAGFGSRPNEEEPNEEEVWQVVDKYTQAVRQTGEMDLLNECRAHACLGKVFDKYLKLRGKAVQNCKRAVQLAHIMIPRPSGEEWFMVSSVSYVSFGLHITTQHVSGNERSDCDGIACFASCRWVGDSAADALHAMMYAMLQLQLSTCIWCSA